MGIMAKKLKDIKYGRGLVNHLNKLTPAEFKEKYNFTKTEVRRILGLDKDNKIRKEPSTNNTMNPYGMGGIKSAGRSTGPRVGRARTGVNSSAGKSVNKNLKNPKK